MSQGDLFNAPEGARRRDKAIERTAEASEEFIAEALVALLQVARSRPRLTTDDLWLRMMELGIGAPREPRAMGAVMRAGCSNGWIEPLDKYLRSKRPECHRRPLRVWGSKICR